MRAAIDVLAAQPAPRVLVAGDMAETGEQHAAFHAEIGRYAKQKGIDKLLATGPDMVYAVQAFGPPATTKPRTCCFVPYAKRCARPQASL